MLVYVTIKSFEGVFICKKLENHPCACPYMPTFALQLHTQPYEAKKLIKEILYLQKNQYSHKLHIVVCTCK